MDDAYILWSPLGTKEKIYPVRAFKLTGSSFKDDFAAWLSPEDNDLINGYLYRLTKSKAAIAEETLGRANRYLPGILKILREYDLPLELACLPLVESAFEIRAVSSAGAAGLWQLMPETARRFGLIVDNGVDERFDADKSTRAAAMYLLTLFEYFENWPLAIAAYNCGEGALSKAISKTGMNNFADIISYCQQNGIYFPAETRQFVPRFSAAMIVMSQDNSLMAETKFTINGKSDLQGDPRSKENELRLSGSYDSSEKTEQTAPPPKSIRLSE